MKENNLEEIGRLAIRHYKIREKIKKLRSEHSCNRCTEATHSAFGIGIDFFDYEPDILPCYIEYTDHNSDMTFDDMCENCQSFENNRKVVNKISLEGAAIKRRMTWKIKKEIKRSSEVYSNSEMLLEEITR